MTCDRCEQFSGALFIRKAEGALFFLCDFCRRRHDETIRGDVQTFAELRDWRAETRKAASR